MTLANAAEPLAGWSISGLAVALVLQLENDELRAMMKKPRVEEYNHPDFGLPECRYQSGTAAYNK